MVNALCAGTVENRLKSRYVHRLTPVTRIGKANAEGLEAVAKEVLPSYFHQGEECIKVCAFCLFFTSLKEEKSGGKSKTKNNIDPNSVHRGKGKCLIFRLLKLG